MSKLNSKIILALLATGFSQVALARDTNSSINAITADARMIALSLAILFMIGAGVTIFYNMQAGFHKLIAVAIGVVVIVSAAGSIVYLSSKFAG